jgi:hypothetical protein
MGVLVTFESTAMLLQHEDFPAALRALKKLVKDASGSFRDAVAVARAKDLRTALTAAELASEVDAYGDLVAIRYVGEKLPAGASDEFPEELLFAWKKLLRGGRFERWTEGSSRTRVLWVDRGVVHAQDWSADECAAARRELSRTKKSDDVTDDAHEVVATESSPKWLGTFLHAKHAKTALEDMRRYAIRHANETGGAFLARVSDATDAAFALRNAGFAPKVEGGHITALAYGAKRLPGSEHHVLGLLESFVTLTNTRFGQLRLAYAATPDRCTTIVFGKGRLQRTREARE